MTTERGTGATPSASAQDVPDALVEKVCQRMADLYGAAHMDDARHVLATVLPDATAHLRARLQAADDRLAEVRREVAGRPCGCHWCCQATSPELRGTGHRNCQRGADQ